MLPEKADAPKAVRPSGGVFLQEIKMSENVTCPSCSGPNAYEDKIGCEQCGGAGVVDIDEIPFSIDCRNCENGEDFVSFKDKVEAEAAGWTEIEFDDATNHNFLGNCPDCKGK